MPHKLLLADDSVTIQRVIELTFADEDVQVIAVGDGRQAIQRVQSDRPDIVLADIGMPERDGYEVAAFIKGTPELAHIPVLLLTGAFEPIDEGRAREVGCDGVLVKPFEPQMVISRVRDLIAGKRPPARPEPRAAAAPAGVPAASLTQPAVPPGSIEDYFDRLDAAFATLDTDTPAPAPPPLHDAPFAPRSPEPPPAGGLADELANWDPDLSDEPAFAEAPAGRPALAEAPAGRPALAPSAPAPAPSASVPAPSAPAPAPPASAPSLAEAFAALLAAEQGRSFAPAAAAPAAISDELVEQIVQRVIERMGDGAVRGVVLDVAERLVREEIARLKADAR